MIKSFKHICSALAVTAAFFFAACDEVGVNERYIIVEPSNPVGTINKAVLVEEFSGQLCVNCPAASEFLENIQDNYGKDTVIVVSLHAGVNQMLGISKEMGQAMGYEGLVTDFGEQMFSSYGLTSEPNAVVDRRSGVLGNTQQWLTSIVNSLRTPATEALSLSTSYDEATRQLTVNVLGRSTIEDGFTGNIHVWLTEDSISTVQRLEGGGYEFDHVFNNIFRASATHLAGNPVTLPYANEPQQVYTATFTLEANWKPEHLSVVAFVDNASGVANAARADVISSDGGSSAAE